MAYSSELKEAALEKLSAHYRPSISSVAREFGISPRTLRSWKNWRKHRLGEEAVNKPKREQDWSLEKRFQVVVETTNMSEDELGAYCRRHGLHSTTIALWRENCLNTLRSKSEQDTEKQELKDELKAVKKDLKRKEKALAEASARLFLQKKMDDIWGNDPSDEGGT